MGVQEYTKTPLFVSFFSMLSQLIEIKKTEESQPCQPVCKIVRPDQKKASICSPKSCPKNPDLCIEVNRDCLKSTITAETSSDSCGNTNAKVVLNTCCPEEKIPICFLKPTKVDTPEHRCIKKLQVEPGCSPTMKMITESQGPKKNAPVCNKFVDASPKWVKRGPYLTDAGVPEDCARNIPDERLIKYVATVSRHNGLQDHVDPISENALKSCCLQKI